MLANLAVEHIQPKGLPAYAALEYTWHNFLLGCINCNSTKKDKDVVLSAHLLPDRDNTAYAYDYTPDGKVAPSAQATALGLYNKAFRTLRLTGLHKRICKALDENGKQVAVDRVSQRIEIWGQAEEAKADLANNDTDILRKYIAKLARESGFFSIWMTVFANDIDMRQRLIDSFPGTRESGCFDPVTTQPVTPSPNHDKLADGGKL
ncbi:HNH endonuclease [Pseudoduganella umbonata]|nr:HNH endonuclease [Pseudoduganella umbonata]MBB3224470.1 hypothetical protein [Pseudoduganella umbonata]